MKYFFLLLTVAVLSGCQKNHKCGGELPATTECIDGFVFWGGDPAADGMGWYVSSARSGAKMYYLATLPDAFKTDGMSVAACMRPTTSRVPCFCAGEAPFYSALVSIKPR